MLLLCPKAVSHEFHDDSSKLMKLKSRSTVFLISALFLTLLPLPIRAAITDGLAGHWTFDETSGAEAADSSGLGNHAFVGNFAGDTPIWSVGQIGNALTFRGPDLGDDYVVVPDFPQPATVFSVSAWAWSADRPTWPQSVIVENGLNGGGPIGLVIRLKNVDQAFGPLGETTTDSNGPIDIQDTVGFPTGSWQQVGAVADGTAIRLYRNGVEVASAPYSGQLPPALGPSLGIGTLLDDVGTPLGSAWQGQIDDVGIWTNALSGEQMAAIFAAGLAGKDLTQADDYLVSPPHITTQPNDLERFTGEVATFSVEAAGTAPFTYQWKRNDQPIEGATNATYSIFGVTSAQVGDYVVVVSNSAGSAESSPATLTVTAADFSTGLTGYWAFDETEGVVAADASPGNHPVTFYNFPGDQSPWVSGRIGGAVQINGAEFQEYGTAEDYEKASSTLTVSTWVWADSLTSWASFLKNWGSISAGQFHFGIAGDGIYENIYIRQTDGRTPNVSDPDPFPTNSWQHVAFVCDGAEVRLYRNGAEVASTPYDGTLAEPPMNCLGVGIKMEDDCFVPAGSAAGPWQGKMDDLALWKRGLSAQEIFAIFQAGQDGKGVTEAGSFIPVQPVITKQPVGRTAFENTRVTLSAGATGAAPLFYQWLKDGQPIEGATGLTLDLGNATLALAGLYQLRVTNSLGIAESDTITVVVNPRPPATLVSEWKFENNLDDTSGHGNEGTAVGSVEYVTGKYGQAIRLAPGNPVVNAAANGLPLSRTDSWSINLWMNLSEPPTSLAYLAGFGPVLDAGGGTARGLLAFSGTDNNNIYFWGNGNDAGSPVPYPLDRWAMITITYAADQQAATLFLDGQPITTAVRTLNDVPADANQISLAPSSNWGIDVGGDFDEFTVWNGVLLASQISDLFDPNAGPVTLSIQLDGQTVLISWPATAQGFTLESADSLLAPNWTAVPGVTDNQVEVELSDHQRFFRLRN